MHILTHSDKYLAPAGRIIMAAFFLLAGISKLMNVSGTAGYIESVGLPMPMILAIIAIIIEVGVAGMLLIGYKAREAAFVLAVFTFIISFPFHGPGSWAENSMQQIMFMKNMAIVGALLFMAAHAGKFNTDTTAGGTPPRPTL